MCLYPESDSYYRFSHVSFAFSLSCGEIVMKDLSVKVDVCPACELEIDRDANAARNILVRALSAVPEYGSTGDPSSG